VLGLHGYAAGFYNRAKWWPFLGVQETYFANEFAVRGLTFGGNAFFRGAEDTAIATWLVRKANQEPERKEFYYWVTLSTHLPLEKIKDTAYENFKTRFTKTGYDNDVLQLSFQLREFFKKLSAALQLSGTRIHVLIVGDHAPPFINPDERAAYDSGHVPYIELIPKKLQ
jgi:phosphoglycerol transferase MdoB-like AlkP superfamily enzyme